MPLSAALRLGAVSCLALTLSCGGDSTGTGENPLPELTSLTPSSLMEGSGATTIEVSGRGFVRSSVVRWNGSDLSTTYVGSTRLNALVAASLIAQAGTATIIVHNPAPGGGNSSSRVVAITAVANPVPTITTVTPAVVVSGEDEVPIVINGTGFVFSSVVRFGERIAFTTYHDPTRLTARATPKDLEKAGDLEVRVTNPQPGGGTSVPAVLSVHSPIPLLDELAASGTHTAGARTLFLEGGGFTVGAQVEVNGVPVPTEYRSPRQLVAEIAASLLVPGVATVSVRNPEPGGGISQTRQLVVRERPPESIASSVFIPNYVWAMAYSPSRDRLYAGVRTDIFADTGVLIEIDPHTGQVTDTLVTDGNPTLLAASGDGNHLYVRVAGDKVQRLDLIQGTRSAPVTFEGHVFEMIVAPDNPNTLIVVRHTAGGQIGVFVYDDFVQRGTGPSGQQFIQSLVFGSTSSTLYAWRFGARPLVEYELSAGGVSPRTIYSEEIAGPGSLAFGGGRLYVTRGPIVSTRLDTVLGALPVTDFLYVDPELGRVFGFNNGALSVFDMHGLERIALVLWEIGVVEQVVRWRDDGLAVRDINGIYLIRAPFAAPH